MVNMDIKRVENDDDFMKLNEDWNQLVYISSIQEITVTWEWLYTWWEVFKQGRQLWILIVRQNSKIVGIAPLLMRKVLYYGAFPFQRLELLGSREDKKDEICSDYLDFIIKKGMKKKS